MKRGLLVLITMCAFAIAMVPRNRRAVNTEEEEVVSSPNDNVTTCASNTPCAWSIYKSGSEIIEVNLTNTYCTCGPGTACMETEKDQVISAFVYRCRVPPEGDLPS